MEACTLTNPNYIFNLLFKEIIIKVVTTFEETDSVSSSTTSAIFFWRILIFI